MIGALNSPHYKSADKRQSLETKPLSCGTDGSNPIPSSGESGANSRGDLDCGSDQLAANAGNHRRPAKAAEPSLLAGLLVLKSDRAGRGGETRLEADEFALAVATSRTPTF